MESTSSSDSGRQSRGLARFWPVHGMPAPGQRQSEEDSAQADAAAAADAEDTEADAADETRTGETPALTGDTQMVALGSRRVPEAINGARPWSNQGGFPPVDADRGFRNPDGSIRHGSAPIPNAQPASRSPFAPASASPSASASGEPLPQPFTPGPQSPFGSAERPSPFAPGNDSPFVPASPFAPHVTSRGAVPPVSGGPASGAPGPAAAHAAPSATPPESAPGSGEPGRPQDSGRPLDGRPLDGRPSDNGRSQDNGGPRAALPLGGRHEPNGLRPDGSRPDGSRPDGSRPDGSRPDGSRPDGSRPDGSRPDGEPAAANGRAEVPLPRPAAGWASVPTSGVPTVTHTPASGSAPVANVGTITPVTGTPIIGETTGGRRIRREEEELRPSMHRSTTLDDAEEPRARGRRAAPDPDETDKSDESDVSGPAVAKVGVADRSAPNSDEDDAASDDAETALDDSGSSRVAGGRTDSSRNDSGPDQIGRDRIGPDRIGTVSGRIGTDRIGTASGRIGTPAGQASARPGQTGTLPTQAGAAPTQTDTPPSRAGALPTQAGTLLGQSGTVTTQSGALPTQPGTLPGQPGALPTQPGALPTQPGALPGRAGPVAGRSGTGPDVPAPADASVATELAKDAGATPAAAGTDKSGQPAAEDAARPDTLEAAESRSSSPMRPGDVDETAIAFWDPEAVTHFRSQWHEVKADFVDDPVTALTRAHDLLTDAVNELTESLLAERDQLDPLQDTATPDTESMRMAMRGYREFLDRILAL